MYAVLQGGNEQEGGMSDNNWNIFECQLCANKPQMSPSEFAAHLKDTHGYAEAKADREMSMHMDATGWHQTDYKWTKGNKVIALQSVRVARRGADKATWADNTPRGKKR